MKETTIIMKSGLAYISDNDELLFDIDHRAYKQIDGWSPLQDLGEVVVMDKEGHVMPYDKKRVLVNVNEISSVEMIKEK